jgi:hypothetical protein
VTMHKYIRAWSLIEGQPEIIIKAREQLAVETCAPEDAYAYDTDILNGGIFWHRIADCLSRFGDVEGNRIIEHIEREAARVSA